MLFLVLAIPFLAAFLVALCRRAPRRAIAWMAGLAPLLSLAILAPLEIQTLRGEVPAATLAWAAQAGLLLSVRLDGLAGMFALMVLGIGALVVMYARYYLDEEDSAPRFFAFLLLFMGSMLGLVMSGNLLVMVVFWEMTSISSFLLIGYWSQREDARVAGVLVGVHLECEGHAVLLGYGNELLHRVRSERDLHAGDREAQGRGRLDLAGHVGDQLVLVEQAIAVDADVCVHRERGRDQAELVDEAAEPVGECWLDRGEPAEAGESDDLQARPEALGRDLADEPLEVVLATVEGAGEAVEGDPLDGRSECGHADTAFMVLVSCSSMWSVSVSEMMM